MRFFDPSRFINVSTLRVLDIVYAVVLLPIVIHLPLPMIVFGLYMLIMILLGKRAIGVSLLLAILALFITQYGNFNVTGLSRLKVFVDFLIDLLIVAVALQRMSREVNFYLVASPILLMALSLFFFQSMAMLAYIIIEIFVMLWGIVTIRMYAYRANLPFSLHARATFRVAMMMFLYALPWVVVLFVVFPRISFDHATYGFSGIDEARMGHDGQMHLDNQALLVPSEKIVMEISFDQERLPKEPLYFRGSVLYYAQEREWRPLMRTFALDLTPRHAMIGYKIKLYPTYKRWLYLLDHPLANNQHLPIDRDGITLRTRDIIDPITYTGTSRLGYSPVDTYVPVEALHANPSANPRAYALAQQLYRRYPQPKARAQALMQTFRDAHLTYTLEPAHLDLHRIVDSFLFERKRGYCVHYAAAFALMARMADIPSRIVTGYHPDTTDGLNNYLIVREKDAHAWVELYVDHRWVRFDPTTTHMRQNTPQPTPSMVTPSRLNLYLMYVKYHIDAWILNYTHYRQLQLLTALRTDMTLILKLSLALALLILAVIFTLMRLHRPRCVEPALCLLAPLLRKWADQGYIRPNTMSMDRFIRHAPDPRTERLEALAHAYEHLRYAPDGGDLTQLAQEIKILMRT